MDEQNQQQEETQQPSSDAQADQGDVNTGTAGTAEELTTRAQRTENTLEKRFSAIEEGIKEILEHARIIREHVDPAQQEQRTANARIAMEEKVPWQPEEDNVIAADPNLTPNQKIQAHLAVNNVQS